MPIRTEILQSYYQDSVVLMRIAAQIKKTDGVSEAAAFTGTASNKALLAQAGLQTPESDDATPEDLIFTVRADTDAQAAAALEQARVLLAERRAVSEREGEIAPHTLDAALRAMPDANLAMISVPGDFARLEALRALRRGLHVFLFSDNVPLEDEIELKRVARDRGLFCMGPDCGTGYVNGIGLGFFNVVARGRVGCVAASGTGLQAVVSRLATLGEGISQGIGVGGRDLSREVGGMMTLFALEALAVDPATEAIVLISKPPHEDVLPRLQEALAPIAKPVVVCCVGSRQAFGGRSLTVPALDQAADATAALLRGEKWEPARFDHAGTPTGARERIAGPGVLGLYTGGTLAYEAHLLLRETLGEVAFNGHPMDRSHPHRIVDLGDDAYTVGRPHPMIAPQTRADALRALAPETGVGILLLDLVLGMGAHEDPAQPLVEALREVSARYAAAGRRLDVLATVIGTPGDPQDLAYQQRQLSAAGVRVLPSNREAAQAAALLAAAKQ